jgi:hypothetical protein
MNKIGEKTVKWIMRIWSLINGRYIGEIVITEAKPFIIGNICHFLPREIQTKHEQNLLKFSIWKYCWTGWKWERTGPHEITKEELLNIIASIKVRNTNG